MNKEYISESDTPVLALWKNTLKEMRSKKIPPHVSHPISANIYDKIDKEINNINDEVRRGLEHNQIKES